MVAKKIKAFTMAEIMITLAVIAVITIATVGIQKSRADYVNKFMYYSAFTALQKASTQMFAEGSSITTDTTITTPGDDDDYDAGECGANQIYVPNAAQSAYNSWRTAWNYMETNYACECAADKPDCISAHTAVTNLAQGDYAECTGEHWKWTATCNAKSYSGATGSCMPSKQLNPNFALVKQYYDGWCDNNDPVQFNLYKNTVEHSNSGECDKIPYYGTCSPYHAYSINTEGEGFCYINGATPDSGAGSGSGGSGSGTTTTTSTTSLLKILPETAAKFCSRFTDMMNGVGSTVCTNAAQTEPFTSANANLTLANGIRFYNFGSEATVDSTNPTHMKDYYTIYADIDGSARSGKLNDDVMGFKIYRSGLVIPLITTAPSIKYLSASVKYKDASNKIQILENNVPYLYAACHAGITTGSDCPAGQTIDPKCNKAAGGFSCSPVMNKPGF